jgi:hypothetical protein
MMGTPVRSEETLLPRLISFGVCDDVRFEQFGKLTLVGYYGQGIRLSKLPAILPKLAVFAFFSYFADPKTVSVRLLSPSGFVIVDATNVPIIIDTEARGVPEEFRQNVLFFQIVPMQLNEKGTYQVHFNFENLTEVRAGFHVSASEE